VVSGGYRAISRDLEDGKKVKKGPASGDLPRTTRERKQSSILSSMSLIRLQKISRRYQMGAETIHALREVPSRSRWRIRCIMGPSGSGSPP